MFKTASGVFIPFPERITEGYKRIEPGFKCNVSFEKLQPLFTDFYLGLEEPLFFILHTPLTTYEEARQKDTDNLHEQVYYMTECSKDRIGMIMQAYGEILFNDGMIKIGISSQVSREELFIAKYKIVFIYSKDKDKYVPLMEKYGLTETDPLVTAWDTFSAEHPGLCRRIKIKGKDGYYVRDKLIELGMYKGEIRVEGK
jgi:hypothetical protein